MGVRFAVTDRDVFSSAQLGLAVAATLESLYPKKIVWDVNRNLIGNSKVVRALGSGGDPSSAANGAPPRRPRRGGPNRACSKQFGTYSQEAPSPHPRGGPLSD